MEILKPGNCGIVCFDEFEQLESKYAGDNTDAPEAEMLLSAVKDKCTRFAKGLCKIDRAGCRGGLAFRTGGLLKEEKEN